MVLFSSVVKVFGPNILKASPRLFAHCQCPNRRISSTIKTNGHRNNHNLPASSALRSGKAHHQLNIRSSSSSSSLRPENLDEELICNTSLAKLGIHNEDALSECKEDVSDFTPSLKPTSSFAAYVNDSPTLQELVKLGVELYRFEHDPKLCNYILSLDYDRDIKNHLLFLHKIGVPGEKFGEFITKNPKIFIEDLDNLEIRVNYLESKRFTPDMVSRIVTLCPVWLSLPTQEIDSRLGFFQQLFDLNGDELRSIATMQPRLITHSTAHVTNSVFSLKEEMGFEDADIKSMIIAAPMLLLCPIWKLKTAFDEFHNKMGIPHELILKQPKVLSTRASRIRCRRQYLELLNRNQYDPKKENYVSLLALVTGTDVEFCKNVAKTSVESYNSFLKTL